MNFNHLFTNEEIEAALQEWQKAYPSLLTVQTIGRSHEDRPIWLLTITNHATGPDTDKPAVWVDANIHATEMTGTPPPPCYAAHTAC